MRADLALVGFGNVDDLLANLGGTASALVLHTDVLGHIAIDQLSGNVTMNAYALLSDLLTVHRRTAG